jgi:hypothetical protein
MVATAARRFRELLSPRAHWRNSLQSNILPLDDFGVRNNGIKKAGRYAIA